MGRNKKLETFRITATPDQWRGLVDDHEKLTITDFHEKYGFSWSGIYPDAVSRGYYVPVRTKRSKDSVSDIEITEKTFPPFVIASEDIPEEFIARSVRIGEGIAARLAELEAANRQYQKSAIINQVLDAGLRHYGF